MKTMPKQQQQATRLAASVRSPHHTPVMKSFVEEPQGSPPALPPSRRMAKFVKWSVVPHTMPSCSSTHESWHSHSGGSRSSLMKPRQLSSWRSSATAKQSTASSPSTYPPLGVTSTTAEMTSTVSTWRRTRGSGAVMSTSGPTTVTTGASSTHRTLELPVRQMFCRGGDGALELVREAEGTEVGDGWGELSAEPTLGCEVGPAGVPRVCEGEGVDERETVAEMEDVKETVGVRVGVGARELEGSGTIVNDTTVDDI
mmetsp:Transcript_10533/g.42969  ORF Transcript_10533/g.42969 Transcript_10533/m.42969 type:complete len:256 (+) Transcript_10533:215-982(+)